MYSIEEAKADQKNDDDSVMADDENVIHQVASMKKKSKPFNRRNSSFFMKKMMSFKSRAQIGADNDDLSSDDSSQSSVMSDDLDGTSGDKFSDVQYVDPPMPLIGQPVKMELLVNRNHKAHSGLKILMEMVSKDVTEAISEVASIPVCAEIDRIQVSHEATVQMAKVRTTRDIEKRVQQNVKDIQKSLNYRKSALIMMNSNYSHQQVRKIEPIYVDETRSIIQHHATDAT